MQIENAGGGFASEAMTREAVLSLHAANEQPFEAVVAAPNQYRYIINLVERGEFSASLYRIRANGEDGEAVIEIDTEAAAFLADEGVDLRDPCSVVGYHADLGFLPGNASGLGVSDDVEMVDPTDQSIWDYLSVHVIEAIRLREKGEVVVDHPGVGSSGSRGHLIWCRNADAQLRP